MGFANRKRDDHGHVIGNDEVDGQKCKHVNGGGKPGFEGDKTAKMNKSQYIDYLENEKGWDHEEAKHHAELFGNDAFDDDYDEEFEETEDDRAEKIANDIGEYFNEGQINQLKKYCDRFDVDFDRAKIELAKRFDKMQKDAGYNGVDAADAALEVLTDDIVMGDLDGNNEMANAELENAIKSADDDVLDEQFGKDTPERKLVGAMKTQSAKETWPPQDLEQYVKKTDNGYSFDMNMFNDKSLNEVMMLTEHPDFKKNTVVHNAIMQAIYKKLKEQPNIPQEGSPMDEFNKSQANKEPKQKVKDIDEMKYPIDQDGNTSDDNKFPDENSLKDVYGENIEEENKPDEQKLNKFSEELKKIGINNVKLENNNIHEAEDGIGISATSRKQLNDWQEKLQKAGYKAKLEWIPGLGGRLVIKR